jgi:CheY-like chemotaxis protein
MASERASSLTRQLLALSRKQIVQRKPLALGTTLTRIQSMLAHTLGETIQLQCTAAPGLPCVRADESGLEQLILNLALNARDAMPTGGQLSISAEPVRLTPAETADHADRRPGDFVTLRVTDTGCGMDPQTLNRVFEPFFTTKPIGRGTGLGLSTVYGIVKQHEGWIEVESQPGSGTTFRVFLPAISELPRPEPVAQETGCEESPEITADEPILVVEDEPDVRKFMTCVLSARGYRVVPASSGADALVQWNRLNGKVRLLLTDMVMPGGISGCALAERLCQHQPGLKVVFTSGYSPEAVANADSFREGRNFIAKPFTRDRLLAIVQHVLGCGSSPFGQTSTAEA